MIILTSTTDNLQVVLGQTVGANQMQCYASFRDIASTTVTPGSRVVVTNNVTAVNVVEAPSASTQRVIDFITIYNSDTDQNDVTIRFNDNGTTYILFKTRLAVGDKIEYHEGKGFKVINSAGSQTTYKTFASSISNVNNGTVYLPLDLNLTSSSGVLPLPITGLEFPIIINKFYEFKFNVLYDVDATTTGIKLNLSTESIHSDYSAISIIGVTATSIYTSISSPDSPIETTSLTSAATTQNCARVEGNFRAGNNGVVKILASHDSGGTLTIKKGSVVHFRQLN